jgi:prepilin signal peptidase PulO-like enzyme (type II secretory pathway)
VRHQRGDSDSLEVVERAATRYAVGVIAPSAWFAIPAAVVGFVLGWLSALLTERLTPADELPKIGWHNAVVRDPLVQGGLAIVWAALPVLVEGDVVHWLEGGLLAVPLVQVAVTDLRTRYVYSAVAGVGLVLGLALGWQYHGAPWWTSVAGALGGAIAFGVLYLLGRLIYRGGEALARGDITIAAMVGAGAASLALNALVYGIVASGILALGAWATTRSRHAVIPYGPGLCLGGLVVLFVHP